MKANYRLIRNEKDWQHHKYTVCDYVSLDIPVERVGEPERFPCWVSTRTDDVGGFSSSRVRVYFSFLYFADLEEMLETTKKLLPDRQNRTGSTG